MKTPITVLSLALSCLIGASALAEPPARAERGAHMDRLAVLLDMNDYQKTEVEKIFKEQREQMRTAHEQARASGVRPSREDMINARKQSRQTLDTRLSSVLDATQLQKLAVLQEMQRPHARPDHRGDKRPGKRGERGAGKRTAPTEGSEGTPAQ